MTLFDDAADILPILEKDDPRGGRLLLAEH
jgi:hypothetical protein